ncbi:hypothetical protein DL96DRAFT_1558849 [Flagelloscypha sp. PMI_526]|nr:hypothetical protein DL96DRAFT_1558849 [Flagelloscypha sp. PMI_526]
MQNKSVQLKFSKLCLKSHTAEAVVSTSPTPTRAVAMKDRLQTISARAKHGKFIVHSYKVHTVTRMVVKIRRDLIFAHCVKASHQWGILLERPPTLLKQRGYNLRKRYQPGWVTSWHSGFILDALCIFGSKPVVIKRISAQMHAHEVGLLHYFNVHARRTHPQNHCVPMLETLSSPNNDDVMKLVAMALLYPKDIVSCDTVGEVVGCFNQLFRHVFFRLEFLDVLLNAMTLDDPAKRPTMTQALRKLDEIGDGLPFWTRRAQLLRKGEIRSWKRAFAHWWRTVGYF